MGLSTKTNIIHLTRRILSSSTITSNVEEKATLSYLFLQLAKAIEDNRSQVLKQTSARIPTPTVTSKTERESYERFLHTVDPSLKQWQKVESEKSIIFQNASTSTNSTYGETPPETLRTLLSVLEDRRDDCSRNRTRSFKGDFVDIGSGNGTVTVCAAMTGKFRGQVCRGIEYVLQRHETAMILKATYDGDKTTCENSNNWNSEYQTSVEFTSADLRDQRNRYFNGASIVFANSPTWDAQLCGTVGCMLDRARLAEPCVVISVNRRFPSPSFNLIDVLTMPCNGGNNFNFYICQKVEEGKKFSLKSSRIIPLSDTIEITNLLRQEDGRMLKNRIRVCMMEEANEFTCKSSSDIDIEQQYRMIVLAGLATSESCVRVLLENENNLFSYLAKQLKKTNISMPCRARYLMVLRAISNFPVGRRALAESKTIIQLLLSMLTVNNDDYPEYNHPSIYTIIFNILVQVMNDPIGHESINRQEIDAIVQNQLVIANRENWANVLEAGREIQIMQRWWQQEIDEGASTGLKFNVLRAE